MSRHVHLSDGDCDCYYHPQPAEQLLEARRTRDTSREELDQHDQELQRMVRLAHTTICSRCHKQLEHNGNRWGVATQAAPLVCMDPATGQKYRGHIQRVGMSLGAIARVLGVSRQRVHQMVSGR